MRDVSRREYRLDTKYVLYLVGSCSTPCLYSDVSPASRNVDLVMAYLSSPSFFSRVL